MDAWVNEDGMLVVRYDRKTLEQEYKRVYDILMADINDFGTSVMVAPIACVYLRLLQGLSLEEAIMVELIYI